MKKYGKTENLKRYGLIKKEQLIQINLKNFVIKIM